MSDTTYQLPTPEQQKRYDAWLAFANPGSLALTAGQGASVRTGGHLTRDEPDARSPCDLPPFSTKC